eukprot:GHVU01059615.1.p1 GENE.GHVU01059615.1~~GHVU01059615.1.p1  ORF type:complete len:458 (+),score=80.21 GHVU01059615.1:260-1633(+)
MARLFLCLALAVVAVHARQVDFEVVFAEWKQSMEPVDSVVEGQNSEGSTAKHWALIVAGSNGWYNYRHQADACHAYQIMKKHGIPDSRIVVMMYDDLAFNEENPTPGIVINHPNGSDVYHGVPHDYTGKDVTPDNFLKILAGDTEAMTGIGSGKVINSGPNDHVFVNFADHGAPGILAFPTLMLKAKDLMDTINSMYSKKKYAQMVFYIEACESGSMFYELLPKDINVYATTASNHKESSYAIYFDKERRTYLGDVYSVKWMEDSDLEDLKTETLRKQFQIVKQETNTSHVQQFGDFNMADEPVDDFQGGNSQRDTTPAKILPKVPFDAVPSGDVEKHILLNTIRDAKSDYQREAAVEKLEAHLKMRAEIETIFKHIVGVSTYTRDQAHRVLTDRHTLRSYDCYHVSLDVFSKKCFPLPQTEYALRHLYKLVNLCEEQIPPLTIVKAISQVCSAQIY